jgi:hypothetical protein
VPARRVAVNPTIGVELPPVDEVKRDRAATAEEAEALLEPLAPEDRVPYALAFYAGLRRSEMDRLEMGRRRPRPAVAGRPQVQERRRHWPEAPDRGTAEADPAARVHAPEQT